MSVVAARHLTKRLNAAIPVTLVRDVDLSIEAGEFVVITGPSGSGKSSLLYLLGLLDTPTEGEVLLSGRETSQLDENTRSDIRLAQIGFVFQFHFLLPEFTIIENVMLPMQRLGKLSREAMKARASELLSEFGLGSHMNKHPKQLSGGQSQRVAIARALANDPTLILADEPTGNLDSNASANVSSALRELAYKHQRAVVAVTHDSDFAALADRKITIVDGQVTKASQTRQE